MKKIKRKIKYLLNKITFSSKHYWEKHYKTGGNSGEGSYNKVAEFKATIINNFIKNNNIKTLLDFGCGDGNQARYFDVQNYIGLDVSKTAVEICKNKFMGDTNKSFYLYNHNSLQTILLNNKVDLTISLDVLYHLIENKVFYSYLNDLFTSSNNFVIIFSTNFDKKYKSLHQIDRKIDTLIKENFSNWRLSEYVENPLKGEDTMADFFIYSKVK